MSKEKTKVYQRKYREEHREKIKAYREEHREKAKAYREEHKEEIRACSRKYYQKNKEERKEYQNAYSERHKKEIKGYQKVYYQKHRKEAKIYYQTHKEALKVLRVSKFIKDKDRVINLFQEAHLKRSELARMYGISVYTVDKCFRKWTLEKQKQSMQLSVDKVADKDAPLFESFEEFEQRNKLSKDIRNH